MSRDPVVDEIRTIRDEYAKRFDYDLDTIYRDIKKQEKESGRHFMTCPPKRIQPVKTVGGS